MRQNDYCSRRGEGPDVLNGYRAVVTAISEDHRVEITWRDTKTGGHLSAWFGPQAISSGALSLGYAMAVAASQGLTSEVSLLYGHGANTFAVFRGRKIRPSRTTATDPPTAFNTSGPTSTPIRDRPKPSAPTLPTTGTAGREG
ncbi:hypothetical protein OG399_17520 [Streptomyces achromogenes]